MKKHTKRGDEATQKSGKTHSLMKPKGVSGEVDIRGETGWQASGGENRAGV